MINKNKQCKVHIFGDEYSLISNESEEHVKAAAQMVDLLIQEIASKGSIQDKKVVVLAALQLASKALLLEQELANKKLQEERSILLLNAALENVA